MATLRPYRAALIATLIAAPGLAGADLHPPVPLLDASGQPVSQSGAPVSPMRSCDGCHDTGYIAQTGFHFDAGAREAKGEGRPWDTGPGLLGRWDPIAYDRPGDLAGDDPADLTGWARQTPRHVGGGPVAEVKEPDCFLCHVASGDGEARAATLAAGHLAWGPTATLSGVIINGRPLASPDGQGGFTYDPAAFDGEGRVEAARLGLGDPTNQRCGQCHGQAPRFRAPVRWRPDDEARATELAGEIFSAQRISASRLNLAGKAALDRPWDVHVERMVGCTDCHPAANNPAAWREADGSRPGHLRADARAPALAAFLKRPDHNLQKGHSALYTVADALDGTQRRCEGCHDAAPAHAWLPYAERHFQAMLCESCHVPAMMAPARQQTDWTVLTASGEPSVIYRGLTGAPDDPGALIEPTAPILLPRRGAGGVEKLAPHNLHTVWVWVQGGDRGPVPRRDLEAAMLRGEGHHPDLVAALDADGDGALSAAELPLDTPAKVEVVAARLRAVGVADPRIYGEIQPVGLHHAVAPNTTMPRDCGRCHGATSALTAPMVVSAYVPAGAEATWAPNTRTRQIGALRAEPGGALTLRPDTAEAGVYVMGHDRPAWADLLGLLALGGVLLGVIVHGGLRLRVARAKSRGGHR